MKTRCDTSPWIWLALVLAVALAIAFLLPVTPQDYWWYLRIGRDALASGKIPVADTLTYTQTGNPVVYFSWGAAVLFWLIYSLGGLMLTVLLRGVLIAAAFVLLWLAARRQGAGRLGVALVLLYTVLASSTNWALRPQLFAYPLFALAIYLLYRWQNGEPKAAWGLPLISLLWVNLHGSFVILLLLTGAALFLGKGNWRVLAIAFALSLFATFINPRGFGSWAYVYHSLTAASSQLFSVEWRPPINSGWQTNLFFLWLLIFPPLSALSAHKLSRLEWAWFLLFGLLALWGERYVIWFLMLLVAPTSLLLADWEKRFFPAPQRGSLALNITLCLSLVLLPLALLPGVRQAWWRSAPPATQNTPVAAAEWLSAQPDLPGPMWSEIGFSSYLEFTLPERPTWIDTRFEVFPVEQWQQYLDISTAAWNWQQQLDQTGANLLMGSMNEQPDLLEALANQADWCQIYRDDVAVIFQRCGGD